MPVTLMSDVAPQQEWTPIELGGGATIEVLVCRPTADQVIGEYGARAAEDDEAAACSAAARHRLRTSIIGWRGVTDQDGNAVEFGPAGLNALIEKFPMCAHRLMRLANLAYSGLSETERKNFNAPSAITSGIGTASAIDSSNSGSGSAPSPQSPTPSESHSQS